MSPCSSDKRPGTKGGLGSWSCGALSPLVTNAHRLADPASCRGGGGYRLTTFVYALRHPARVTTEAIFTRNCGADPNRFG